MTLSKKQKRWLIISGIIVGTLLVFVLALNLIIANIIEKKITNALKSYPETNYHITLGRVGVNILNGNVNLRGLQIEPDTSFIEQLKQGELMQSMVVRAEVPLFRLAGFSLFDAIVDGKIDVRRILIKNAKVQLLVGKSKKKKPKAVEEGKKKFRIDSIRIEGLSGINLGKFDLKNFKIEILDVVENKIISENKRLDIDIVGIESVKLEGEDNYFAFHAKNAELNLSEEEFNLPGGNYKISIENMRMKFSDSLVVITDFVLKPQIEDRFAMAKKLVYTTGIFNVKVHEIRISEIDAARMLQKGELIIGHVQISGMDMDIFKDKRKPWNKELRPMYPNQALRNMDFPFYVGAIDVDESYLKYHEESAKEFGNLMVTLDKMEGSIKHVTSLKDSMRKPMTANLKAKLFNTADMVVDILLPLNSRVDTVFISGSLGKSKMSAFDPALFPALGMKITSGTLNSVVFKARANRRYIDGEMVMMYDGLETEVQKKNEKETNKFMSWLANSVVRKSNPGKNDKLRTVPMHFDRDMYKGFINIAWKGVQTGLVHTVSPAGKVIKEEKKTGNKNAGKKKVKPAKELTKKEQRKKKREEKKEKK